MPTPLSLKSVLKNECPPKRDCFCKIKIKIKTVWLDLKTFGEHSSKIIEQPEMKRLSEHRNRPMHLQKHTHTNKSSIQSSLEDNLVPSPTHEGLTI